MNLCKSTPLGDVLEAFMAETARPDRDLLERYVAAYPDYAAELAEFAAEWLLLEAVPDAHVTPVDAGAEAQALRVMERLHGRLRQVEALGEEAGKSAGPVNPFAHVSPAAMKTMAVRLGLDTSLMAKLKNRLIRIETIPQRLVAALAAELDAVADVVHTWLNSPPRLQGARFKADGKPRVSAQESFTEAVQRSSLTDAQKKQWTA